MQAPLFHFTARGSSGLQPAASRRYHRGLSEPLPRLRLNLDFMPSPVPDRPGLFIRDPYRYSDAMLVIPPALVACLEFFDGDRTELDLRAELVRLTNSLEVSELQQHLTEALSSAGFLEDETFERMREERHREFAAGALRHPAHAGGAYPAEPGELRQTLARYMTDGAAQRPAGPLCAIAAPHVSPEGGWESYRAAYAALGPEYAGRTFVVLGTSHYGEPERFGLTRKSFVTPLGETSTDPLLLDRLAAKAGPAAVMEDYCHSFEHTIELQVIFLQHLYGPGVRVLPVLCGPFAHSLYGGGNPEDDRSVRQYIDALAEMAALEGDKLFWVLGIDMAHMGSRYHDPFQAAAGEGIMTSVEQRDRDRIARAASGDAAAFWEAVKPNHDDLKWCGSSPLYTFLRAMPGVTGELLHYQQWNIDPQSVVSFAGMAFQKQPAPSAADPKL